MDKKWLDRGACPECGSSDGNVRHSEGYSFCFVCETRFGESMQTETVIPMKRESNIKTVGTLGALTERSISKETAQKYNTEHNELIEDIPSSLMNDDYYKKHKDSVLVFIKDANLRSISETLKAYKNRKHYKNESCYF